MALVYDPLLILPSVYIPESFLNAAARYVAVCNGTRTIFVVLFLRDGEQSGSCSGEEVGQGEENRGPVEGEGRESGQGGGGETEGRATSQGNCPPAEERGEETSQIGE